jgi:hypothetical protein
MVASPQPYTGQGDVFIGEQREHSISIRVFRAVSHNHCPILAPYLIHRSHPSILTPEYAAIDEGFSRPLVNKLVTEPKQLTKQPGVIQLKKPKLVAEQISVIYTEYRLERLVIRG